MMKTRAIILVMLLCAGTAFAKSPAPSAAIVQKCPSNGPQLGDWAQIIRYAGEDARVPGPTKNELRVVFMGDSITDFWGRRAGVFFPGKPYINRGISAQVTAQMLVRFRQDVIALKPRVVVILAGTNDLAYGTDPASMNMIEGNLSSMSELARANGIKVVLASVTPVNDYVQPDQTKVRPLDKILELNAWIKSYAQRAHVVYLDYYPALLDAHQQLKKALSDDGLHPNAAGYAVMAPLAQQAIDEALAHG